jgi:methionyl-tRNA formyltransferase
LKKKYTIAFLFDKKNNWISKYIKDSKILKNKKFSYEYFFDYKKIKKKDVVVILSYTKILPEYFLEKNKLNIVVHSSKLPKDRGFAPLTYQVLRGENKIFNTLFKITKKVDQGPILMTNNFIINKTDLYQELRLKQSLSIIKLLTSFLNNYPKLIYKKQVGKSNFNIKRLPIDSELNIKKSLKSQFNLLRVCDNKNYPAFFKIYGKKFILKIYKD